MKYFFLITTLLILSQTTNAMTWQEFPAKLSLVQEHLNRDLYSPHEKIVHFSFSPNRESVHLQILNNICPRFTGYFTCLAQPSVALEANYPIKHIETDSCGVQTMVSSSVEVSHFLEKNRRRFAQVRIKDFTNSICEIFYPGDVQVELKDTTVDSEMDKVEIHFSTMVFNYLKSSGPVTQ